MNTLRWRYDIMKIIICGAGQVGFNIAKYLEKEGHNIVMIEHNPTLIQLVRETLDVQLVEGFASHPDVLERAGAQEAEFLIAVTRSDEVNMLICLVAHTLFETPFKIARIRNTSYLKGKWAELYRSDCIPIDHIISPETEVSQAIARNIQTFGAFDVITLANGAVKAVGLRCRDDCLVLNTPLRQLTTLFPDLRVSIILIVREGKPFVPGKNDEISVGDEVYFMADTNHVVRVMAAFGYDTRDSHNLLVVGGGNIGLGFCLELSQKRPDINVSVIESRPDRARYLAEMLPHATIICGDAFESAILSESSVQNMDSVVSVMSDDEDNIILSLVAKRYGAKQVMTLLNNPNYMHLAGDLGVDGVINPRTITVSSLLQHVRKGRIRSVHSLYDGFGEIIEADVHDDSKACESYVSDLMIPGALVVAALIRSGQVLQAHKSDQLQPGDRVILFTANKTIHYVEDLFSPSRVLG